MSRIPQAQASRAQFQQPPAANQEASAKNHVTFKPFMANQDITLTPEMVIAYLAKPTKSGAQCTREQAVRFIKMCQARGLNPWEGDAYIVGYDAQDGPEFSIITSHQAFMKRSEVHPEYNGMESGLIVQGPSGEIFDREGKFMLDDEKLLGAWAKVHFKTRAFPMVARLNLKSFVKNTKVWRENTCGMIVKCAETDAQRRAFPNQLGGMYLDEEVAGGENARLLETIINEKPSIETRPTNRTAAVTKYIRESSGSKQMPVHQEPQLAPGETQEPDGEEISSHDQTTEGQQLFQEQEPDKMLASPAEVDKVKKECERTGFRGPKLSSALKNLGIKSLETMTFGQALQFLDLLKDCPNKGARSDGEDGPK